MEVLDSDFEINNVSKSLSIRFDRLLGDKDISHINEFLIKKRSYHSILQTCIIGSIQRIFNTCQDKAILIYLKISYRIKNLSDAYTIKDLEKDILIELNNKSVRKSIETYIDQNYEYTNYDDSSTLSKTHKKINQELQFTDEHVIALLHATEFIRLCIPLITDFCERRKVEMTKTLYDIFKKIIVSYQGSFNILNKIDKFIYSRVVSTQYSDKAIWNLLSNKAKDVNIVTNEFMIEIITGILPKSICKLNIINLLHVVIKRKIGFEFQKNHKITFKPVNFNQEDSEGLTQFDRWVVGVAKKNENKIIINEYSIKKQIKNLMGILKIKITKDELEYYSARIKINKPQTNLLFLFFSKFIGGYFNLYNCNRNEYIILLIIFYKWLQKNSFECLSNYVIAIPDKLNEKRMATKSSKVIQAIKSSKSYKTLLKNKYYFINGIIEDNSIIIKMIGNMSVSKYLKLQSYEDYIKNNRKDKDLEEYVCRIENLSYEMLEFIRII